MFMMMHNDIDWTWKDNRSLCVVSSLRVSEQYHRYGVEIKNGSMMNDGTESWVVITRGLTRYVTELALDHTEPMRGEENTPSGGRSVA